MHVEGHKLVLDDTYTVTANDRVAALGVLESVVSGRIRDVAVTGH